MLALSGVVLHADAKEVARVAAPLPSGLNDEVSAEIDFLTEMPVEGVEGGAAEPRGLGGTVVDAELEFPGLGAASGLGRAGGSGF